MENLRHVDKIHNCTDSEKIFKWNYNWKVEFLTTSNNSSFISYAIRGTECFIINSMMHGCTMILFCADVHLSYSKYYLLKKKKKGRERKTMGNFIFF